MPIGLFTIIHKGRPIGGFSLVSFFFGLLPLLVVGVLNSSNLLDMFVLLCYWIHYKDKGYC